MPSQASSRTVVRVIFNSTAAIEKEDLDRAISGGIKRAGLKRAPRQLREEIFSTVYYKLTLHYSSDRPEHGSVGSLAFKVAYHVAIDTYRRPGEDASRRATCEVADATPAVEFEMSVETAEARLLRIANTAMSAGILKQALKKISPADRATLIAMLERDAPMSRRSAAEIKLANATAQREKRAKDRLGAAVRERGGDAR